MKWRTKTHKDTDNFFVTVDAWTWLNNPKSGPAQW
jgi:hypothetical protein